MLPNAPGAALAINRWLGSGPRSEPHCVLVKPLMLGTDLGANLCFFTVKQH